MALLATRERLSQYPLFKSHDLDETREIVAKVFCEHRLESISASGTVAATHNRFDLGRVSVNYLDYGAAVRIHPGELQSFYLVQIPLKGKANIRCGESSLISTPTMASIPNPLDDLEMIWGEDNPQVLVHVQRHVLENHLNALLGREVKIPIQFELGMDLSSSASQSWLMLVETLMTDAENGGLALNASIRRHYEDLILTGLLLTQPNNFSHSLASGAEPATPRSVRQAIQLCLSSPELPLTMSELATATNVSMRSLQAGFKKYVGMTPMEYLRDVRLSRVREALLQPNENHQTIAQIAFYWGFNHLGRFASAYKEKYGELPSETRAK